MQCHTWMWPGRSGCLLPECAAGAGIPAAAPLPDSCSANQLERSPICHLLSRQQCPCPCVHAPAAQQEYLSKISRRHHFSLSLCTSQLQKHGKNPMYSSKCLYALLALARSCMDDLTREKWAPATGQGHGASCLPACPTLLPCQAPASSYSEYCMQYSPCTGAQNLSLFQLYSFFFFHILLTRCFVLRVHPPQ